MTASWKIKAILKKRHMTASELAEKLGVTKQSLSSRFTRDNLSEKDIAEIAALLNCTAEVVFTDNEDNQKF